jgi:hypothetical protein
MKKVAVLAALVIPVLVVGTTMQRAHAPRVQVINFNAELTAGFFTVHYLVNGTIQNTGDADATNIQLRLTVTDHGEPVIVKTFQPDTSTLTPNSSTTFSVPFTIDGSIQFQYIL